MIDHVGDQEDLTSPPLDIDKIELALCEFDAPLLDTCHVLGVQPA